MTQQEIEELAGHRKVSAWVIKLVADAVAIEREECAKLCEELETCSDAEFYGHEFAAAIRARGNT